MGFDSLHGATHKSIAFFNDIVLCIQSATHPAHDQVPVQNVQPGTETALPTTALSRRYTHITCICKIYRCHDVAMKHRATTTYLVYPPSAVGCPNNTTPVCLGNTPSLRPEQTLPIRSTPPSPPRGAPPPPCCRRCHEKSWSRRALWPGPKGPPTPSTGRAWPGGGQASWPGVL